MSKRAHVTPIGNEGIYELDTAAWRIYRPVMDKARCVECGICMTYCPVNSITVNAAGSYEISYAFCKGCGICAVECGKKAITMVKEGEES